MQFTGGPAIWFDVLDYDFGPMSNAETRNCTFTFTNVGDAPLTVMAVEAKCGCTAPTFERGKVYQPGESGKIAVAFTPPTGGHQAKSMGVLTDAKNPGEVVNIRVIGEVETVLSFEPRSKDLGEIRRGQAHEGTLELVADAPETIFESVSLTQRSTWIEVGFAEPGVQKGKALIKYRISPDVPWGIYQTGVAEVLTKGKLDNGQEITKKLPLRIVANVVDDVRATEYTLRCGVHNFNEPFTAESIIYSDKPFEIVDLMIEPLPPGSRGTAPVTYQAVAEPSTDPEKKGWKIKLVGTTGGSFGFITGKVKFGTRLEGSDEVVPRHLGIHGYVVEPGGSPPPQFTQNQQGGAAGRQPPSGGPAAPPPASR
jgi:hypothetical protein